MQKDVQQMTDVELDHESAVTVMGWKSRAGWWDHDGTLTKYSTVPRWPRDSDLQYWHPCTDRNQSRLVTDAALAKGVKRLPVPTYDPWGLDECPWFRITPRDEVVAAILAVRALSTGEASSGPVAEEKELGTTPEDLSRPDRVNDSPPPSDTTQEGGPHV